MTTKISFRLAAEFVANASEGILLGDFNNWNPEEGVQLQKEDGSMAAEIALVSGKTYQYRYFLNDGRWVNDFSGTTTWVEVHGNFVENNVIEVPAVVESEKPAVKKAIVKKEPVKKAVVKKTLVAADDLVKIEGIGKKIALLFKKQGILTYKDLSRASIKSLKAILEK